MACAQCGCDNILFDDDRTVSYLPHSCVDVMRERLVAMTTERDEVLRTLDDALEMINHWSSYADQCFKDKWDLNGDKRQIMDALNKYRSRVEP